MSKYQLDYCVGSVHHVDEMPTDFSQEMYDEAETALGGSQKTFQRYFALVKEMIEEVCLAGWGRVFQCVHQF